MRIINYFNIHPSESPPSGRLVSPNKIFYRPNFYGRPQATSRQLSVSSESLDVSSFPIGSSAWSGFIVSVSLDSESSG